MDKSLAVFVSDDTTDDEIQQAIGDIQYAINQESYGLVNEICSFVKNKDIPDWSRSLALEAFACARHPVCIPDVMELFDWVFEHDSDSNKMVFTTIACMDDIPSRLRSAYGERLRQLSLGCQVDIVRAAQAAIESISPNVYKLIDLALDSRKTHTNWCDGYDQCNCGALKYNEKIERVVEAAQQDVFGFIPVCLPEPLNERTEE